MPQIAQFLASERIDTSATNAYQANLPIAVGPEPTDLFVAGDADASRVRRLNPDGTNEILASYVHTNSSPYYGVTARRGSVRHGLGDVAWIAHERDGSNYFIYGYIYADGQIQRSPGLASTSQFATTIFSDGSDTAVVAHETFDTIWSINFMHITWDGNPANAPVLASTEVFAERRTQTGNHLTVHQYEGNFWIWYKNGANDTKFTRQISFPVDMNDGNLEIVVPNATDTMGAGYLSSVVGAAEVEVYAAHDPGTLVFTTPPLPNADGFGSYYDQGLVRTHEWDAEQVITWGAAEFGNAGQFAGLDAAVSNVVAYLNGGEAFLHQISTSDGFLYQQYFFISRPLRIGLQVWGLVCYDDYAGGLVNDDSFIQAFGYEFEPPPEPIDTKTVRRSLPLNRDTAWTGFSRGNSAPAVIDKSWR